jgi:hypothetical protein
MLQNGSGGGKIADSVYFSWKPWMAEFYYLHRFNNSTNYLVMIMRK